jgi:HAD superfamily hydrolase (TIGR01509 family)
MPARRVIRNIVLDIGWVLVRLNYRPLLGLLKARGAQLADRNAVMARIPLVEHECGRLPGRGLLEALTRLAPEPLSLDEAQSAWLDMFELEAAMLELAHRLGEHQRVYLLSNIGDLHWAHLSREFRLHALGHGALPSYLAGVMKPHPGIYAQAERRFALEPRATVFIDDRDDNIAGACARGWHGIVHRDFGGTLEALRRLEVVC